jgi:hypothetical protein
LIKDLIMFDILGVPPPLRGINCSNIDTNTFTSLPL